MILALILFFITYVLMLIFTDRKHYIALCSALIFVILGIISPNKILGEIDFNVLLMILGTMGTVSLFIESKMPSLMADIIIDKVPNVKWMVLSLTIFAGVISAFVDNVATVLMIAPVVLMIVKKLKINPVPIIIAIAIFSNLEGAATLVGDTTSILLAGATKMNFLDFFFYNGKIGLFFIVQFGLIAASLVLAFLQRKNTQKIECENRTKVNWYLPTILLVLTIFSLIGSSFLDNKYYLTNGLICVGFFIVGLIAKIIKYKNAKTIIGNLKEIDYETILLLASLFVIIGGIKEAGVIDTIGNIFLSIGNGNVLLMYTLIVFVSVFISAFIDNIPYVATMLPVVAMISTNAAIDPTILYYGLIIGATLGGNYTPIGASANITAIGILKKNGYKVTSKDFFQYSIPITTVAILVGYVVTLLLYI